MYPLGLWASLQHLLCRLARQCRYRSAHTKIRTAIVTVMCAMSLLKICAFIASMESQWTSRSSHGRSLQIFRLARGFKPGISSRGPRFAVSSPIRSECATHTKSLRPIRTATDATVSRACKLRHATAALALLLLCATPATAATRPPIVVVPLDDRPVTRVLPADLGEIAGVDILEPPRRLLGRYLVPGQPDAIREWLNAIAAKRAGSFVLSNDMLVYGGLVASRVPGISYADAFFRMQAYAQLRAERPRAWIMSFGTIMRLAPTGVPALGSASTYFAAYPTWTYLQSYANLHDPPLSGEVALAAHLSALIGEPILQAYLATRLRDYDVDHLLVQQVGKGAVSRAVLGQDDAGPIGLHVREVAALRREITRLHLARRVAVEPGADELGVAFVAQALAREIHWKPRVLVRYSTSTGGQTQDPIEFAPIDAAIGDLIRLCGGARVRRNPQLVLYVRVPKTSAAEDDTLIVAMRRDLRQQRSVAFVDETFLNGSYESLEAFADRMLRDGIASRLDAYAAWNTNANSVGTALAEAIAAGVGRRAGTYSQLAHREFTFTRILDDVVFHATVRPDLNQTLNAEGIRDHTYLLAATAKPLAQRNRALLWNAGVGLLAQLYPNDHLAAIRITLPWNRTFETGIDAALAPNLPGAP